MTATIEGVQEKLYAAWNTDFRRNRTYLWLMVPQDDDFKNHCELDEGLLWPAYQCIDCGVIVGSKVGSYIKLSPSTTILHKHTKNRSIRDQFNDVVYDHHIDVIIYQNRNKVLSHCYSPRHVVGYQLFDEIFAGKKAPENNELGIPINTSESKDYSSAVSELVENYRDPSLKLILQQLITETEIYNNLSNFVIDNAAGQPVFAGLLRLTSDMLGNNKLSELPNIELKLAIALRLKPHDSEMFDRLLLECNIEEKDLIRLSIMSYKACRKLLEWAIAWAEIFFTHTLS
jgi:hypothetical protein